MTGPSVMIEGSGGAGGAVAGMSWVAWRQSRAALLGVLGLLAGYAFLAIWERTHPNLVGITESFSSYLYLFLALFLGAPLLAREYDTGTHQLAWTQSVPRSQWLTARLAVNLGIGLVAAGLLHLMTNLVAGSGSRPSDVTAVYVTSHGLLPYAQALCAIAWGVASGAVLGRLLPALGVTLVGSVVLTSVLLVGGGGRRSLPFWSIELSRAVALMLVATALIALTYRVVARRA
jgi:hypothetical protein